MHTQMRVFWYTTWIAWKSGALSQHFPELKKVADVPFPSFLAESATVRDPSLRTFLGSFEPRPDEFFIVSEDDPNDDASFIVTSQRLFLTDRSKGTYASFDLADIVAFRSEGIWSTTMRLTGRDGTEHRLTGLEAVPQRHVLQFAIDQAKEKSPWNGVVARHAEAQDADETKGDAWEAVQSFKVPDDQKSPKTGALSADKPKCQKCGGVLRRVRRSGKPTNQIICVNCGPATGKCPVCGAMLPPSQPEQCSNCRSSWDLSANGGRPAAPKDEKHSIIKAVISIVAGLGFLVGMFVILPLWALRIRGFPVDEKGPQLALESIDENGWQFAIRDSNNTVLEAKNAMIELIPEETYKAFASRSYYWLFSKQRPQPIVLDISYDDRTHRYSLLRSTFNGLDEGQYYARVGISDGTAEVRGLLDLIIARPVDYKYGRIRNEARVPGVYRGHAYIDYHTGPFIRLTKPTHAGKERASTAEVASRVRSQTTDDDHRTDTLLKMPTATSDSVTSEAEGTDAREKVHVGCFEFRLPPDFHKATGPRATALRVSMIDKGKRLASESQLVNPRDISDGDVSFFSAFEDKTGKMCLILCATQSPDVVTRDGMYSDSMDKIDWGIRSGELRASTQGVQKKTCDGIPCLLVDVETRSGDRLLTYMFFLPETQRGIFQCSILSSDDNFDTMAVNVLESVIESLNLLRTKPAATDAISTSARAYERPVTVVDGGPLVSSSFGRTFESQTVNGCRVAWVVTTTNGQRVIIDGLPCGDYREVTDVVFSSDGERTAYAAVRENKWVVVVDGRESAQYDGVSKASPEFSPDGSRVVYAVRKGNKWLAVIDSDEGVPYDGIGSMIFSPEGKRLAYWAKDGEKSLFVIDGHEGTAYDRAGNFLFSPDGKRFLYVAQERKKMRVISDGAESSEYDTIAGLMFSPNSQHVFYGAMRGNRWCAVVDGAEGGEYDKIGGAVFSRNGEHLAYAVLKGIQWRIVVDGLESTECGSDASDPRFSFDGRHVAYGLRKDDKWLLIADGKEVASCDGIVKETPIFSTNGDRMVYAVVEDRRLYVVEDDERSEAYDGIAVASLGFTSYGGHVFYVAVKGGKEFLVLGGRAGTPYDGIRSLVTSPDERRIAYCAAEGDKWFVVVDGQESDAYDAILKDSLVFSSNGKRIAYAAMQNGKCVVMIDGQEDGRYDDVDSLMFSPDGIHVIYRGKKEGEWFLVIDGRCVTPHLQSYCGPVFTSCGHLECIVTRVLNDRFCLCRVSYSLEAR